MSNGARVQAFKAIAAMAENRVIGDGTRLPWHLPEDFRWFKAQTLGQIVVMGRRTFEGIGRPLPGRETIVLSRGGFAWPGVRTVASLAEIDRAGEARRIYICGGAQVYALALPWCDELYLTRVKRVAVGDVLFPPFEEDFALVREIMDRPEFRVELYANRHCLPAVSQSTGGTSIAC